MGIGAILGGVIVLLFFVCFFLLAKLHEQRTIGIVQAQKLAEMDIKNKQNAEALQKMQQPFIATFGEDGITKLAMMILNGMQPFLKPGSGPSIN